MPDIVRHVPGSLIAARSGACSLFRWLLRANNKQHTRSLCREQAAAHSTRPASNLLLLLAGVGAASFL